MKGLLLGRDLPGGVGPYLLFHDAACGPMLLLYEWGADKQPWLFIQGGETQWVSFRQATPDDLARLHGLDDPARLHGLDDMPY